MEEEDFLILLDEFVDVLDEEYDSRQFIYDICDTGFNPNKDILTMKALESYLNEIID